MPDSFTVQILFSGLVAFSPSVGDTESTVLVLNDVNSAHMSHQTFLAVAEPATVRGTESDFRFETDPTISSGTTMRTFVGGGYDLTVEGVAPGSATYQGCRVMLPGHDKPATEVCLLKAAALRASHHAPLNKYLTQSQASLARELALRFHSNAGVLRPYDDGAEGLSARELKWQFPLGTPRSQYVPEQMEWVSPSLSGDTVTLWLTPFGGGTPRKIVVERNGAATVTLSVHNIPRLRDFCAMGYGRYTASHLERLARFSEDGLIPEIDLAPSAAETPTLADLAEISRIDMACSEGHGGGEPVICYGTQIP